VHVFLDNQIHADVDTIVSFDIQSRQVSEGRVISVSCHINCDQYYTYIITFVFMYCCID